MATDYKIVVVCMVECLQCLGLYFVVCCHPDPLLHPLTPPPLSWLDIFLSKLGCQATDYNYYLYSVYYYADVSKSVLVQCVYSVLYVQCMCSFHVQYVQAFI